MNTTSIPISAVPFLQGLSDADLQELGSVSQLKALDPGQVLLKVGDLPAYLMFVLNGSLQAHECAPDGRIIGVGTFNMGDAIGWLPLIDGLPMTCSIQALEQTQL